MEVRIETRPPVATAVIAETTTGVRWEIYDHWRDDPASFETLVGWPLRQPISPSSPPTLRGSTP